MNNPSQNPKPALTGTAKLARAELDRALSLHFQGNNAGALKSLRKAIELDPTLAHEPFTANLARELTGSAPTEALKNVTDVKQSKELIHTAQKKWRRAPQMRRQRNLLFVFAILCLAFIGLLVWSIRDGSLEAVFAPQTQIQKANLEGYDYYVAVPGGSAPETGWPLVVGFHGYGGKGEDMLGLANTVNAEGAIYVTPTLGTYEPNPGDGPLETVSRILFEVGKQYPLKSRGAVLLGFSQGGSFAYRFSVRYSNQVAGAVIASAPELDAILPTRNIPYVITWGELDEIQQFVLPQAYSLQNSGFNVQIAIVPGVGHSLSRYAIDQALLMLEQP